MFCTKYLRRWSKTEFALAKSIRPSVGLHLFSSATHGQILRLGLPRSGPFLLAHAGHVTGYDPHLKVARWVCELLTPESSWSSAEECAVGRRRARFRADPLLPPSAGVHPDDYRGSGLQRGHLAAAANHRACRSALSQTFYMSNVVPQWGAVNGGVWRQLEEHARRLALRRGPVWLTSGPLFVPDLRADGTRVLLVPLLGSAGVPVPSHLFKTLVYRGERGCLNAQTFVVQNAADDRPQAAEQCLATLEEVEQLSGLALLGRVPRTQLMQLSAMSLS